ncbi:shikimate kinase [Oleiphilus messinensis]|uniref:Shikimate kinase n=1 Tax=Oleiphilus messinensis TaxID=141451 RepID=A0A1Y0I339_9GAMM|nr:shikimate kinase AroK [Oleiphilus messinensis]ARU54882.1 shikimate kinase [Oleiphilus messinensis]
MFLKKKLNKSPDKNVVLVGPMGAGKTTIGKLLAKELGFQFTDSDKVIEQRCGADIPWIFDVEGEAGFRGREKAVIQELGEQSGLVIATGGGAVLDPDNQLNLKEKGIVVYLKTSVAQQYERTFRDKNRPLLQTDNPLAVLSALFEKRDPIYSHLADIVVKTDKKNPKSVVKYIVSKLAQL